MSDPRNLDPESRNSPATSSQETFGFSEIIAELNAPGNNREVNGNNREVIGIIERKMGIIKRKMGMILRKLGMIERSNRRRREGKE